MSEECRCGRCQQLGSWRNRTNSEPPRAPSEPPPPPPRKPASLYLQPVLLVVALLLTACGRQVRPEPEPMLRWAYPTANVMASEDMAPTCRASWAAAVSFVRTLGRDMTLTWVDDQHPAIALAPREGEISVRTGFTSEPKVAGETSAYTLGNGLIGRAEIVIADCDPYVAAHELLHALGLEHSSNPKSLMWFSTETRQWALSKEQLVWITQCRRAR